MTDGNGEPVVLASQWTTLTSDGITREQTAKDVMIAMIHATAKDMIRPSAERLASEAVRYTDALIAELNKEQTT